MTRFTKSKHNPIEVIRSIWPSADISHITYDPNMRKGDYSINRQSTHDGTLLFTLQMMDDALINLVNMRSYWKNCDPVDWGSVKEIRYTIGSIKHATVFGLVNLGCSDSHKYHGQRERIRIPVKAELVMKGDKLF